MSDDRFYIQAAREVRRGGEAERDETLWSEALSRAGGNEIEARNDYVNRRVGQLAAAGTIKQPDGGGSRPVSSVSNHPEFISVAKYSARNNVDERHVIQSIKDGHYNGRKAGSEWYIFIGKSRFKTFEEKNSSFFFENANENSDSRLPGEEPDNLVDLTSRSK
jgi:hypothetical protein